MDEIHRKGKFFSVRIGYRGILEVLMVALCSMSLLAYFGRWSWLADITSHFRIQYAAGLLLMSVVMLFLKRTWMAAVCCIIALINLPPVLSSLLPETDNIRQTTGRPFRAVLANVNTRFGSIERTVAFLKKENPDFVVLEEINDEWASGLNCITNDYPYSHIEPREDNFGIAVFSRNLLQNAHTVYIGESGVPSIMTEVLVGTNMVHVIGTHPPPPAGPEYSRWRNDHLADIPRYTSASRYPVILLGDLNTTPWNHYYKKLVRESGLKDSCKGRRLQPTWPSFNPFLRIPIDHCLYSDRLFLRNKKTGSDIGSDHFPIILDFMI